MSPMQRAELMIKQQAMDSFAWPGKITKSVITLCYKMQEAVWHSVSFFGVSQEKTIMIGTIISRGMYE